MSARKPDPFQAAATAFEDRVEALEAAQRTSVWLSIIALVAALMSLVL